VNGAQQIELMQARIRSCATLPDTLAAGFDAFETIRWHARQCEDRAPELFAAFMTATSREMVFEMTTSRSISI